MRPREAVSVILLRDGSAGHEVLLLKRNPAQRFMGGAWVFPGGATHPDDADRKSTGIREVREEAGIELPADAELIPYSRWITPERYETRFDTWFFVAAAPEGAQVRPDGQECVDARWLRPADALAAGARGELELVFPTIKHLEQLAETEDVAATLAAARALTVEPILPKVVTRGDGPEVVLPGDPDYESA